MKSLVFLVLACFITIPMIAQVEPVVRFYDKYKNLEQVSEIQLQGWVLKLASSFADEAEGERLLNKITRLRVLSMEEGNLVSAGEYRRLIKDLRLHRFEELIKIVESGQHIDLLIREQGDQITDVLVLISGREDFLLLSLEGHLDFSDLNDLNIEVDGAEHFKKVPERKEDVPRA